MIAKTVWIAVPVALLAATSARADDTPADITVLGKGLAPPSGTPAYGQTLIDRDRLVANASGRVEDVLQDVAGFSEFRRSDSRSANPSAQGANLRALGGNAASRTLVLLDGVPMADPFFGYIPYAAIVPDRLSAVRVQRGGGGGAFGAGAVAGTIDLASATRTDLAKFSATGLYGSRHSAELSGSASPNVGAGFVTISGRWDRGDGFYTTPVSQRVPATARARYESWSTGIRAVAPVGDKGDVQARALIYRDDRTLRFMGADSHAEAQDASLRFLWRGPWQVDALAYVQARNFSNVVISGTTYRKSLDQRDTPALGLGGKIELRPPVGGNHLLRFGVDTRRASGTMDEVAYNANLAANPVTAYRQAYGRQLTVGGFIEDDWTIGRLVLTAGGRVDRWTITDGRLQSQTPAGVLTQNNRYPDRSGWEGGGRVGALWQVTGAVALRAAAYTGFRLPTLNELYRSFVVFPVTTNANPNLRPERLRGVEAGIDFTPDENISMGVTVFDNRLDDAIANVTIATNVQQRRNINAIEAQGVELSARAKLGAFDLSGSWAYTYSKVRAPGTSIDGLDPAQTPRHAGSATLAWKPVHGPLLSATLRYTGRAYEDDRNSSILKDALTVGAYASVPIRGGVSIIGRVENLLDETVITRNQAGSIDIGTPRTVWIGLRVTG